MGGGVFMEDNATGSGYGGMIVESLCVQTSRSKTILTLRDGHMP